MNFIDNFNGEVVTENSLVHGNCLDVFKCIERSSVGLVLCDPPYGTTNCEWDQIIPLSDMWRNIIRVLKPGRSAVLSSSQPFTSVLVASNLKMFKYELIWSKNMVTGHMQAKNKPLKQHENILVFSLGSNAHEDKTKNKMIYNPQGLIDCNIVTKNVDKKISKVSAKQWKNSPKDLLQTQTNYPKSILQFDTDVDRFHPTQKPVKLFEYLINTYSNEGDVVLDFTSGSGTTAVAAINTNRKFICIEQDDVYYSKSKERIISLKDNNE